MGFSDVRITKNAMLGAEDLFAYKFLNISLSMVAK
jgi:hypothetical protein